MDSRQLALDLLGWNRSHLVHDAALSEAEISEKFAPSFTVRANGRIHPADHATYLAFLDGFRATIAAIDYDVRQSVADGASVVLAMTATVRRLDGEIEQFEAMLLLSFDSDGRVLLWDEVYLKAV